MSPGLPRSTLRGGAIYNMLQQHRRSKHTKRRSSTWTWSRPVYLLCLRGHSGPMSLTCPSVQTVAEQQYPRKWEPLGSRTKSSPSNVPPDANITPPPPPPVRPPGYPPTGGGNCSHSSEGAGSGFPGGGPPNGNPARGGRCTLDAHLPQHHLQHHDLESERGRKRTRSMSVYHGRLQAHDYWDHLLLLLRYQHQQRFSFSTSSSGQDNNKHLQQQILQQQEKS